MFNERLKVTTYKYSQTLTYKRKSKKNNVSLNFEACFHIVPPKKSV